MTPEASSDVFTLDKCVLQAVVQNALNDLKAVDLLILDVTSLTPEMDCLIIASGNSNRHVKSLADNVVSKAKEIGFRAQGVEGREEGEWVLVDFGDVVVNLMQPKTRDFYDLEGLWSVGAARTEEP